MPRPFFNALYSIQLKYTLNCYYTAVQFSFNKAEVAISEGGDLPSQISILKSGEINGTISFRVSVISGTATENEGTLLILQ